MIIGIKRRAIEDKISAHFEQVPFDAKNAAWVDDPRFEEFIFSLFELRRYYETSQDTAVGLIVVQHYVAAKRALDEAAGNRQLSIDRRESAQRLMYELNYQMEAVMYELERNRQASG